MNEFNENTDLPGLDEDLSEQASVSPENQNSQENEDYDFSDPGHENYANSDEDQAEGQEDPNTSEDGGKRFTQAEVDEMLNKYTAQIKEQLQPKQENTSPNSQNPLDSAKQQLNLYIQQQMNQTGMSREQVVSKMQNANKPQPKQNQELDALKNQIQELKQSQEIEKFTEKVTDFQKEFSLNDKDMEIFAQNALDMGVNLYHVNDFEKVFRGLYPKQYELRSSRRQANMRQPQLYRGANPANPNAGKVDSKQLDKIVNDLMRPYEEKR